MKNTMATINKVTVLSIVYNEEQWIWYALQSVLPFVDSIVVVDTGSTDKTVDIVQSIKSNKIKLEEVGKQDPVQMVSLLNKIAKEIKTEWYIKLDGDEIWSKKSIEKLIINLSMVDKDIVGIVVKARLPVGDLFHYQSEEAGKYELLGMRGHYNIRAYRKRDGYHWKGTYPLEAYVDSSGNSINEQNSLLFYAKECEYWHPRHLLRSSVGTRKIKLEIGKKESVTLPEVFYMDHPPIVPSPWVSFFPIQWIAATVLTPLLRVKRFLTHS